MKSDSDVGQLTANQGFSTFANSIDVCVAPLIKHTKVYYQMQIVFNCIKNNSMDSLLGAMITGFIGCFGISVMRLENSVAAVIMLLFLFNGKRSLTLYMSNCNLINIFQFCLRPTWAMKELFWTDWPRFTAMKQNWHLMVNISMRGSQKDSILHLCWFGDAFHIAQWKHVCRIGFYRYFLLRRWTST